MMAQLKAFLKTSKRELFYEFFEIPEAARDSVFHEGFDLGQLECRPLRNHEGALMGAEFYNKAGGEVSAVFRVDVKKGGKADLDVIIKELDIRSYYVFKNEGFFDVPVIELLNGFSFGFEGAGKRMEFEITKQQAEKLLSGHLRKSE